LVWVGGELGGICVHGIGSIPSDSLGGSNLIPPLKGSPCEGRDSGLHADFDCFPGQRRTSAMSSAEAEPRGRVSFCIYGRFPRRRGRCIFLEEFVETVFSGTWGLVPVHGSEKTEEVVVGRRWGLANACGGIGVNRTNSPFTALSRSGAHRGEHREGKTGRRGEGG